LDERRCGAEAAYGSASRGNVAAEVHLIDTGAWVQAVRRARRGQSSSRDRTSHFLACRNRRRTASRAIRAQTAPSIAAEKTTRAALLQPDEGLAPGRIVVGKVRAGDRDKAAARGKASEGGTDMPEGGVADTSFDMSACVDP
jgi:hypothetical protein